MKVLGAFFILVFLISVSYTVLSGLDKSGFKIESLLANISKSPSIFELPRISIETGKIQENNSSIPNVSRQIFKKMEAKNQEIKPKVEIKITGISKSSYYSPSLITLASGSGAVIDLTGWKIKTRQGEFTIPQGIEKYSSFASQGDIFIDSHQTIYLIGAKSPLGKNFRTNACMGYLNQVFDFYPHIWNSCPSAIKKESPSSLSPYCRDFLSFSYAGRTPNYSKDLKIATDSACVKYINRHFNYAGCYSDYSNNADFLGSYWHIYMGSDIVDPLHDTISLYDAKNKLISQYSY